MLRVSYVEDLDKNSAAFRRECLVLASENGFFRVVQRDQEAKQIYNEYEKSVLFESDLRNKNAPDLFYKNEILTNIDIKPVLKGLKKQGMKIHALYGRQDGIFSSSQMDEMKYLVGENDFKYLDNCSHYLYADQQKTFLNSIERWLK